MKLIMDRDALLSPLQGIIGVIERRQSHPILGHVLISAHDGQVRYVGTDMEVELSITVKHPVEVPGESTLPAKKLLDICRSLPQGARLEISVEDDRAVVRSGKSRFTLATLPAKEFPGIGEISPVLTMMVDADRLKGIIKDTEFAMAYQDVRYYLNGLLIEIREQEIRACATDGHRLAMNGMEATTGRTEPYQIILPRKGVSELLRMLEGDEATAELRISPNHLQARLGQWTLISKLIDGRFPDYERLILQKGNKVVIADRERLKQGLARTAIISTEKFRGVRIALEQDLIRASANNTEREEAEEEIEVDYTGEGLEIGFNVSYLLDALSVIKTESVRFEFQDTKSGCLIRPDGDGAGGMHVIMPIRL